MTSQEAPLLTLRLATAHDLPAINAIYNYYVLHSTTTYQTEPSTLSEREEWFEQHGPDYPVTVAEVDQKVVGWGALSRFHPRAAYRPTVENSVYVDRDWLKRGIGKLILADLVVRAQKLGYHSIMALISSEQTGSLELHRRLGFEQAAQLKQVGWKFDRWLDVIYMQLML